jgi:hypothetical protein
VRVLGRTSRWQLTLMTAISASACGGTAVSSTAGGTGSGSPIPGRPSSSSTLPTDCGDTSPCTVRAGIYVLGDSGVIPGLTLSVPPGGWQTPSGGADQGEFDLIPPGRPNDRIFFWKDLVAVRSTGAGHGTVLTNVGTTPDALVSWMSSNPALLIVARPAPVTIGGGINTTSLVVGVSPAAQYGDSRCPGNPRCADLFTNRAFWGKDFFGVGGNEEVRLYLAAITVGGQPQTIFVALDATDDADLAGLTTAAAPIIDSIYLPAGAVAV